MYDKSLNFNKFTISSQHKADERMEQNKKNTGTDNKVGTNVMVVTQ